ncbi:hypothetical protein M758_6G121800 [Ceratodon purpureus]|nr:hypothetical protein M758_6G121800 [Ceratodon purpureus]
MLRGFVSAFTHNSSNGARDIIYEHLRGALTTSGRLIERLSKHWQFPHNSLNGAEDIVYVQLSDGSIQCTGWCLSRSKLSSARYKRDLYVEIEINDGEGMGVRFNLNRISGKDTDGVPVYEPTDEEVNVRIFRRLRPGRNKITFYIPGQPNSSVEARIYRWEWDSKVIPIDMDGTVTRSELLGILRCYTGEHYLHTDVSTFLLYLKALGYKLVYLTARPITSIKSTREYLVNDFYEFLDEEFTKLPDGPVLTSCDGRFHTALNYVGDYFGCGGTSHLAFKASYLTKIGGLFDDGALCAGFGNTIGDSDSYLRVGIPEERIFTVQEGGSVFRDCPVDSDSFVRHNYKSYGDLLLKCRSEGIFPHVERNRFPLHSYDDFFGHIDARMDKELKWIRDEMQPES